jgi:hypothetical protein
MFTKVFKSYSLLINKYPDLLGIDKGYSGVLNLSDESFATDIHCHFSTRPVKLIQDGVFTLLHRAIQKCYLETSASCFAGIYVFGSNDLHTWQLIAGNDRKNGYVVDILTTRAHLKIKYFVFVFASTMKEDSSVGDIEVMFYEKITNKIR